MEHDLRPELEEESDDVPHCAQFADPRLMRTIREPPRGADYPDDDEVPHCAQFANPRTVMKTREPSADEDGVPHCAQFADMRTITAARRQRERQEEAPGEGDNSHLLAPAPVAPSRPDPGPAPPRPPNDPIHCRDPAVDQEEPHSQDTQSPAEPDQPTHDMRILDCDEAELEQMVAKLNEDPNADPDAAETPAGREQGGGVFTVPKLLAILIGMVSLFTTTEAHRLTIPNGTSASPGLPKVHFYRLDDGPHTTYEGEESTATTWTLILILAAAVAMLLARVQHLEHLPC